MANDKLMDRARDELFSHINRCGVLSASPDDQKSWMTETIDYLAERYPDLADTDLDELQGIGLRFCAPAISRNKSLNEKSLSEPTAVTEIVEAEAEAELETEDATAGAA